MLAFGLSLGHPGTAATEAAAAEAAGLDLVAVGEHVFHHGSAPNPYVELAAAAAATERIRLLSCVSLLPLYPAVLVAKLAATLDVVSSGRFDLGVGAGGEFPQEYRAVGVDPRTRFRRLDESLEVLKRLFSGDTASFDGEFTSFEDLMLNPPPVQPGGPPIWLGGRGTAALRRAGRHASSWLPYMVTPQALSAGLVRVDEAATAAGRAAGSVTGALFAFVCVDPDEGWARTVGTEAVSRTYEQDFAPLADKYLLLGSPARVAERIDEYHRSGATSVVVHLAAPAQSRQRVFETLVTEVLPRLDSR